jgi:hypothetical protein
MVAELRRHGTSEASLTVTVANGAEPASDLMVLSEGFDGLITGAVRAVILQELGDEGPFARARRILLNAAETSKANIRFFPDFPKIIRGGIARGDTDASPYRPYIPYSSSDFDPFDPYDAGVETGINSWMRRIILSEDPALYRELFSFAHVARITKQSPLLIEVSVLLGAAVLLPAVIVVGLFRAVDGIRRGQAETDIRKTEKEIKDEELVQRRIQTEILGYIRDTVKEQARGKTLNVGDGVLAAAATITSPSVADLAASPLIEKVTLGISSGK